MTLPLTEYFKTAGPWGAMGGTLVPSVALMNGPLGAVGNTIGMNRGATDEASRLGLSPAEAEMLAHRSVGVGTGLGAWARTLPGFVGGAVLGGVAGDQLGGHDADTTMMSTLGGGAAGAAALSCPAGVAAGRSAVRSNAPMPQRMLHSQLDPSMGAPKLASVQLPPHFIAI